MNDHLGMPHTSAQALVPFEFDGIRVRIVMRDGEPWFVLADVCRVLEVGNTGDALARLDSDEKDYIDIVDGTPGTPRRAIINESGLYSLILTSRKPEAKRFKKWITSEVIPSIRKTGSYGVPQINVRDPSQLHQIAIQLIEVNRELEGRAITAEAQVGALKPKAEALDRIATADGSLCVTDAAKALQMPPSALFKHLRTNGWIYKRAGASHDVGYQDKVAAGYIEHKVTTVIRPDGTEKISEQVRITPKGLTKLARDLGRDLAPQLPL
jgi:prophage antirepressor-like protein